MTSFFVGLSSGIGLGSVYALVALSFTVIIASTGLLHFAIGSFVMLATVGAYMMLAAAGLPTVVSLLVVLLLGAAVGILSEVIAVRPFYGRTDDLGTRVLVSTLGLALILDAVVLLTFGPEPRGVPAYVTEEPWLIGGVPVRPVYLVMTVVVAVLALALWLFLQRTRAGQVLRAYQDDPDGTRLLGIRTSRVVIGTFGLAGLLAGLAGFLVAPVTFASPFVGAELLLKGFAAMAIGGFGSFTGALWGGLIVGLITGLLPLYLSVAAVTPAILLFMVVLLIVSPSGLFGEKKMRMA
jgi:branched-subunit amino acid ABC-type transport system permease component